MFKKDVVVGNGAGDESKGASILHLSTDYRWICRPSQSQNCGNTIYYNGSKIVRHALPAGDFSDPNQHFFLGSEMLLNPEKLLQEIIENEKIFPGSANRIYIDPDIFVITQKHIDLDAKNNNWVGSTKCGVSYAAVDKYARVGTKFRNLIEDNNEAILKIKELGCKFKYSLELFDDFQKSNMLFLIGQSVLLSITQGTYPFVTSTDSNISCIGSAGFSSFKLNKIYGVGKVYMTRVGNGCFPTEFHGDEALKLRTLGNEFGSTSGRARRCGALDIPMIRYSIKKSAITNLIVSKFDVLENYGNIKVCTNYEQGEPVSGHDFFAAKPIYKEFDSWSSRTDPNLFKFLDFIEEQTQLPISYYSYGVNPEDFISYHNS